MELTKSDLAERGVPDENGLLPLTAAKRAELTRLQRENAKLKTEPFSPGSALVKA